MNRKEIWKRCGYVVTSKGFLPFLPKKRYYYIKLQSISGRRRHEWHRWPKGDAPKHSHISQHRDTIVWWPFGIMQGRQTYNWI